MKVPQHGILRFWVGQKMIPALGSVKFNPRDAFPDVNQVETVIFQRGFASSRILSRMYQWRLSVSTTWTLH